MPLIEDDIEQVSTVKLQPTTTTTKFDTNDSQYRAIQTIDGTAWFGTYYNQLLKELDKPKLLDLALDPTSQQYQKFINYPLMLDGDLSSSTIAETGEMSVTGNATLYPGFVPNNGDHFVATSRDGTILFLQIKSPERVTYLKKSAYRVSFQVVGVLTTVQQDNIELKTVETYYFDNVKKELTVTPHNTHNVERINVTKLVAMYYDEFYDLEVETLVVPTTGTDNGLRIYDPELTSFWHSLVGKDMRLDLPAVRLYSCSSPTKRKTFGSVLQSLLSGVDVGLLAKNAKVRRVSSRLFAVERIFYSIGSSKFDYVIWPRNSPLLYEEVTTGNNETDDYYIFSEAFYSGIGLMTDIETIVKNFLDGQMPTKEKVVELINALPNAEPIERFYRLPILILLYRIFLRA